MIDFFKLERLNVDNTDWSQSNDFYNSRYWGKLVVDKYYASYFTEDGKSGQNILCSLYGYGNGTETIIFDHRQFMDQIDSTHAPNARSSATVTPLDVELLIKLKQGGFTKDDLVTLREAGII